MKKTMLSLVAAMALLTAGVTGQALSADVYGRSSIKDTPTALAAPADLPAVRWTGLWAGLGLGYGFIDNQITADIEGQNFLDFQGLGGQGAVYDIEAGYDVRFPGANIVIGVVGGYGGSEIESSVDLGGLNATYEHGTTWWVGGRAGMLFANDRLLAYGKVVYAQNDPEALKFTGGSFDLDTREGIGYGGGIEGAVAPGSGLFLGVEAMYFDYDEKTVFASGGFRVNEDPDVLEIKGRLKYKIRSGGEDRLF